MTNLTSPSPPSDEPSDLAIHLALQYHRLLALYRQRTSPAKPPEWHYCYPESHARLGL